MNKKKIVIIVIAHTRTRTHTRARAGGVGEDFPAAHRIAAFASPPPVTARAAF